MRPSAPRQQGLIQLESAAVVALLGLVGLVAFMGLGASFENAIGGAAGTGANATVGRAPAPPSVVVASREAALARVATAVASASEIPTLAVRADEAVRAARAIHGAEAARIATPAMREVHGPVLSFLKDTLRERRGTLAGDRVSDVDAIDRRLTSLDRASAVSRADVFDAVTDTLAVLQDSVAEGDKVRSILRKAWARSRDDTGLILPFHGANGLSAQALWDMRRISAAPFEVPFGKPEFTNGQLHRLQSSRRMRTSMFADDSVRAPNEEMHLMGKYLDAQVARLRVTDPEVATLLVEGLNRYGHDGDVVEAAIKPFVNVNSAPGEAWQRVARLFEGEENVRLLADLALPHTPPAAREAIVRDTARLSPDRRWEGAFQQLTHRPWLTAVYTGTDVPLATTGAVASDRYPLVLNHAAARTRAAAVVDATAPTAVSSVALRRLSETTLTEMRTRTVEHMRRVTEAVSTFGEAKALTQMLARSEALLVDLAAAVASPTLSFDTLRALAIQLVDSTSDMAPSLRTPEALADAPWFPMLEDAHTFWSYAEVWKWRHAMPEAIPAAIPVGRKGTYATPSAFFTHDRGHVSIVQRSLRGESAELYAFLKERFDLLEKTHPTIAKELALPLGNWTWEEGLAGFDTQVFGQARDGAIRAVPARGELNLVMQNVELSDDASTVLTAWAREWLKAEDAATP